MFAILLLIISVVDSTTPQALIVYQNVSNNQRINVTCDATYDCRHKICHIMISDDTYNIHYFPITRVPCENVTSSDTQSDLRVVIACYKNRQIVRTIQCDTEDSCYRETCQVLTNESITALAYVALGGTQTDCQNV